MAFFVVARTSDGSLQLVSSATFPSRQAAMSALSEATREPGFPHWDAELLVVDLDSAVPVLLVRPSQAVTLEPVAANPVVTLETPEFIAEIEMSDTVEVADSVSVEVFEDAPVFEEAIVAGATEPIEDTPEAPTPDVVEELVAEVEVAPPAEETAPAESEPVSEGVIVEEVVFEPYAIEDVAIGEAIAEEILAELESGSVELEVAETSEADDVALPELEEPEAVETEPVEETPSFTVSALMAESAIADAVLETEAPADAPVIDEIFGDLVMPDAPEEPEPAVSIDDRLGLGESEPGVEVPQWTLEPEPAVQPEAIVGVTEDGGSEAVGDSEGGVVIAWPWDTEADDEPVALTENLIADIELVNPPAEPIEDAIEEDSALDSLLVEPEVAVAEAVEIGEVVEVVEETSEPEAPGDDDPADVVASVGNSRDEIADFIFDLENVTDIPEAAAKDAGTAGSDEAGLTCNECVYDETCPNRDQRSPQECGSFQWKIA